MNRPHGVYNNVNIFLVEKMVPKIIQVIMEMGKNLFAEGNKKIDNFHQGKKKKIITNIFRKINFILKSKYP